MSFNVWLKQNTGLAVYDFYALIWGEFTKEKTDREINEKLNEWIKLEKPSAEEILKAKELINSQGK